MCNLYQNCRKRNYYSHYPEKKSLFECTRACVTLTTRTFCSRSLQNREKKTDSFLMIETQKTEKLVIVSQKRVMNKHLFLFCPIVKVELRVTFFIAFISLRCFQTFKKACNIYIKLFHEISTHLETESMKRTFQQLSVLAWKNLLLQMRHPWVTLIELLIPAFLSAMLLIGRVQVEPTKISNITTWDEFEVGNYRFRGK